MTVIVFDVNETLSDLAPLAARFADVGRPPELAATWFAGVLRDGFALTVAGAGATFAELAAAGLRGLGLSEQDGRHVLDGFGDLPVHPDVPAGVERLAGAGFRLATLSNGGRHVAEGLLARAGLRDRFAAVLTVEDAGVWKPAAGAYAYAADVLGVHPHDMVLVAVHPWDVDGAHRAGLRTAWIDRHGAPYPAPFSAPDVTATSLVDLAAVLSH
ncbi:MAG TPA: haloacid dehalogenase type II [Mycobacteriales bacterium]|nr:haloacid dehalogenase type II [Mycobacteriales bacterium]